MVKRLAYAVWWFGTLVMLGGVALLVGASLFGRGVEMATLAAMTIGSTIPVGLMCWVAAFVVGGSFWRPPKID